MVNDLVDGEGGAGTGRGLLPSTCESPLGMT